VGGRGEGVGRHEDRIWTPDLRLCEDPDRGATIGERGAGIGDEGVGTLPSGPPSPPRLLLCTRCRLPIGHRQPRPAHGALKRPIRVFPRPREGFLIARAVLPCAREELVCADEELICDNEELMCEDEDLVFANEELISANEGLISANEELEIASEGLISANEELICAHELLPSHDQPHDRDRSACFCAQSPHVRSEPAIAPLDPPTQTHHPPLPTPIRIFAKPQIRRPESGFSTSLPLPPSPSSLPPSPSSLPPSLSSSRPRAFVPISSPSSLRVSVSPW